MDEINKTFAPELAPSESRRWIGRLVIAVLMGVAIWNFLAAFTENLILPILARLMEVDAQSPLYLGTGKIGAPGLFTSVVELCLAGIVSAIIFSRLQRPMRVVRIVRRVVPAPSFLPVASVVPSVAPIQRAPVRESQAPPPEPEKAVATAAAAGAPSASVSAEPAAGPPIPAAQKVAPPQAPAKPKAAKPVYYNLVGDPVDEE